MTQDTWKFEATVDRSTIELVAGLLSKIENSSLVRIQDGEETITVVNNKVEPTYQTESSTQYNIEPEISTVTGKPKRKVQCGFSTWKNPNGQTIYESLYRHFKGKRRFHISEAKRFLSTGALRYSPSSASPALSRIVKYGMGDKANNLGESGFYTITDIGPAEQIDWYVVSKDAR